MVPTRHSRARAARRRLHALSAFESGTGPKSNARRPWFRPWWAVVAVALGVIVTTIIQRRSTAAQGELAAFYDWNDVPELRLQLDSTARRALAEEPRRYARAQLSHAGETYGVGVALKGHRSMRGLDEKPAFKIDIDRFDRDQTFHGARRLILNNLVEDPTLLRESLAYLFVRSLGLAGPRTGHVRVFVDGADYGLYLMVEALDDTFLERHFGEPLGVLYEGEYGCDLFPEDVPGFERDAGKDRDREALHALARAAAAGGEAVFAPTGPLAMDQFLTFLAASALLGDFDGYRHSHNYRIYRDAASGRWHFSPWGLDRVFQHRLGIFDSEGWLATRCFGDPACRLAYVRTLAKVVESFEAARLPEVAARLDALIRPHADADPRKPYDARKMRRERAELEAFLRERPQEVRGQLACIDAQGNELDRDGDGHGCMDCDDRDPGVHPRAAEPCDGVDNDCSGVADDAAACECARVEVDGREYHMCNWPRPWSEAAAACGAKGLVLAPLGSGAASAKLYEAARGVSADAWWIGYSDREREGHFLDTSGAVATFTFWDRGQPKSRGCNEDCVALREDRGGRWQDAPCHFHRPFICAAPR